MASSLQQQLAAIAANSTHQLDLKAQKARHSDSLLFEPREAASQDFEFIFRICFEGFEELCQLDARYVAFANNLFSEQSKNEDRSQMTAKENDELNTVIDRFLALLGGRLLLKPALKAAEWLVRRFRAHEFNTDSMLHTFLPYHASPIFPVLLSILPKELPTNFRFLHPYVSSRQCPPRHAIVAATTNQPALFTAFNQRVLEVAKLKYHSALVIGFWASVTAQAVNGMIDSTRSGREAIRKQKEEDLLLRVLPILNSALSIKGVSEVYLGACMIMTILATRASPDEKVLDAMLEAIAAGWTDQTFEDGLTCLAVVAEEKHNLVIPTSVILALAQRPGSVQLLVQIAEVCRVDKLVAAACIGTLAGMRKNVKGLTTGFVSEIVEAGLLPEKQLPLITKSLEALSESDLSTENGSVELLETIRKIGSGAEEDGVSKIVDAPEDSDVEMEDKPETPVFNPAKLPKLPAESWSFLDAHKPAVSAQWLSTYQRIANTEEEAARFFAAKPLQQKSLIDQPNYLSFLAYAWSSKGPTSAKSQALAKACAALDKIGHGDSKAVDLQGLLPYIVSALADMHKAVRVGAVSLCIALSHVNERISAHRRDLQIWGKDSLYGKESSKVSWLSFDEHQKFVQEALLPLLEDCTIDAQHIIRALPELLNASKGGLKSATRTAVFAFLASHACVSPVLPFKLRILEILKTVGKISAPARVQIILPYAQAIPKDKATISDSDRRALVHVVLENITSRSSDEIEFLKTLGTKTNADSLLVSEAFERLRTLWPSMKEPTQIELADWLLDLSLQRKSAEDIQTEALGVLQNVSLSTGTLVHLTEGLPSAADLQPSSAKKQRSGRLSDAGKLGAVDKGKADAAIQRTTRVLEIVESSDPGCHPGLLKGLFYVLGELYHYRILLGSELTYLQGSLMNSLLLVVDNLRKSGNTQLDRSIIRADLIVECVRTTSSTQVHHAALLLMSSLASWAPDLVLHSVMPLFTFMSSTILKQGDDYSAHVTEQTVARIVPPLAETLKKSGKNLISGAADLLLSFTAAFEHIPIHRRASLFRHLVQTLGPDESLFAIMAMLIERYSEQPGVPAFVANLMAEFSNEVQLHSVVQYLDLVLDTLKTKRGLSDLILAFGEKNKDEARLASASLLDGLADILSKDALRKGLAKELKKGGPSAETLRRYYAEILEMVMHMALQLKEDNILGSEADRVLTASLSLMPTKDFIDSSAQLMQAGSDEIRQQVFRSLEQRASTAKQADPALQKIFIDVLPNCTWFVAADQPADTVHAAIACVDEISERFGKTDRAAVKEAASIVAGEAALCSDNEDLQLMAILCLASMVEVLGADFIPMAPETLKQVLHYLENMTSKSTSNISLYTAIFALLDSVLDHVDMLLSGKLLERILELAVRSAVLGDSEAEIGLSFCKRAAAKLPAQYFLAALDANSKVVAQLGPLALQLYVETFQHFIRNHSKAVVTQNSERIFKILLFLFDIRSKVRDQSDDEDDEEEYAELYALVNDTAMDAVLKLNDATFRPFFNSLCSWAIPKDVKSAQLSDVVDRSTSLYSFLLTFFEQLKSLVTSYASSILAQAQDILTNVPVIDSKAVVLVDLVAQTLASSFRHDQDGFWQSPARFEKVLPGLVNLLGQARVHSPDEHVIPAIRDLAAAAGSSDHYKAINTAVMAFMRHEHDEVRLAAVKCERAITEKLNIDWLALLPEMLPFINELQEDDDAMVERETLRWMKEMEDVTGQSIQDMLR